MALQSWHAVIVVLQSMRIYGIMRWPFEGLPYLAAPCCTLIQPLDCRYQKLGRFYLGVEISRPVDLVGRYHAVGGRYPRGAHFKANGTFPPLLFTN